MHISRCPTGIRRLPTKKQMANSISHDRSDRGYRRRVDAYTADYCATAVHNSCKATTTLSVTEFCFLRTSSSSPSLSSFSTLPSCGEPAGTLRANSCCSASRCPRKTDSAVWSMYLQRRGVGPWAPRDLAHQTNSATLEAGSLSHSTALITSELLQRIARGMMRSVQRKSQLSGQKS